MTQNLIDSTFITHHDMSAVLILYEMRIFKTSSLRPIHVQDTACGYKEAGVHKTSTIRKTKRVKDNKHVKRVKGNKHVKRVKHNKPNSNRVTWCRCAEKLNCDHISDGCNDCETRFTPQRRIVMRAGKSIILCNACWMSARRNSH